MWGDAREQLRDWEAATPSDGLLDDDDDDDEKLAAYAAEGLERLCEAMGGDEVTRQMLPHLQPMLDPSAPWTARHAALVALATVCEHGGSILEPHVGGLMGVLVQAAGAPEPRLRWASAYCLGLMCDEFSTLTQTMHEQLVPLLLGAMSDASARVRSAAALASVNLLDALEEAALLQHAQPLLAALHPILAGADTPPYVAYSASSSLAVLSEGLSDAAGKPMSQAYTAFMPHLASRLDGAIGSRYGKLAAMILRAIGALVSASAPDLVRADASALVPSIAALLSRPDVAEDRDLLRAAHLALASFGQVASDSLINIFHGLVRERHTHARARARAHTPSRVPETASPLAPRP